ncbi:YqeG family HAD IIIA-type phosphatase [Companilactobacillus sp.]|jgi:HAD superfamily phosphatase (TIGR01668 family)|uniref:YqeG family HAD IIIA-type phosphatase n=1 Tax=Companilactobacillus sp. TaxID=2767905 RepID=UPI0025B9C2E2|nr:YqeG family HAD IIIA-type phosphatase [Companilactobacillus sp.]MCH4007985.1 YqeG family HAD IIIA-type phosphatase [Companilactobacillus sp.]MCH4051836.1 YqeG family HAD IIIA-type phosphatase [Companilactobacillus sp.]MCH4075928.1 YqeG family HAD IIIA-type phosphatase [Companilactobacillus sp.]MCH4124503.1 YqeG family HAD IIIA-type phosphatase [Companilactobacillus sp.]MCH4132534.1 YqeG family HAD IIIA-type phosphatase [Companilactobacillus sp.]
MFKPNIMLNKITDIDVEDLKEKNITTIMTDLDNTILPWNSSEYSLSLRKWLNIMKKANIEVLVVSNNSYKRIEKAVSDLQIGIVARAKKPLPFEIIKYLKENQIDRNSVLFVGDQVLTDVLAGSLSGVATVLVKPIVDTDAKKTRVNRFFERPILKYLQHKDKNLYWKDSLNDRK